MTDENKANKAKVAQRRREKLALALRDNLNKRKAQARALPKASAAEEPEA